MTAMERNALWLQMVRTKTFINVRKSLPEQSCRSIGPIGDGDGCGSGVVLNPKGASAI
jgi:hypothetical protein